MLRPNLVMQFQRNDEKIKEVILATKAGYALAVHHDSDGGAQLGWYEYKDGFVNFAKPKTTHPGNQLTLDHVSLSALHGFLNYICCHREVEMGSVSQSLSALSSEPQVEAAIEIALSTNFVSSDFYLGLEARRRLEVLKLFKSAILESQSEEWWQKLIETNPWLLGSAGLRVISNRIIDESHRGDFLAGSLDGYLDVVELKRPDTSFFASGQDRGNLIPSQSVVKAITQVENYMCILEAKSDSINFSARLEGARLLRPASIVILGSSEGWGPQEFRAQRILNSSLGRTEVVTFDQVYERAMLAIPEPDLNGKPHLK